MCNGTKSRDIITFSFNILVLFKKRSKNVLMSLSGKNQIKQENTEFITFSYLKYEVNKYAENPNTKESIMR